MKRSEVKTNKKGDYAEKIVMENLHSKDINTFKNSIDVPHPFDFLLYKKRNGIWELNPADVKAKPKMSKYNATGIDQKDYQTYLDIQDRYNMNVYLFFVDEEMGKVYGNYLNELEKEVIDGEQKYPFTLKDKYGIEIRIFHMDNMITQFRLTPEHREDLIELTDQKYIKPHIYTEAEKIKRLQELKNLRNEGKA